jgi:SulP family sulfate permease
VAVYDFSSVGWVDTSAALAIDQMIELSRSKKLRVLVSGLQGPVLRTLDGLGVLKHVPAEQRFAVREDAIRAAVAFCRANAAPRMEHAANSL